MGKEASARESAGLPLVVRPRVPDATARPPACVRKDGVPVVVRVLPHCHWWVARADHP
jgi:hypothetical protein